MRFSIRDLLWAMLVVGLFFGLAIGWWRDHRRLEAERDHYKAMFQKLSDEVIWAPLRKFVDELELGRPTK
jgi:hypothetical protein